MKLKELLEIFPFGSTATILEDNHRKIIAEADIYRSTFLDAAPNVPTKIIPFFEYTVLEFYPEDDKIHITLDMNLKEHTDYTIATTLTII